MTFTRSLANSRTLYSSICFLFLVITSASAQDQYCQEQLPEGSCLYNMESTFLENFRLAIKLDSTNLRNPPMGGLADALAHESLLADPLVATQIEKVVSRIHASLLELETREELCERLQLSLLNTKISKHDSGILDGQVSFGFASATNCYSKSPRGQLTFTFQSSKDSVQVTLPERFEAYFRHIPVIRKSGEEIAREAGIFPDNAILSTSYSQDQEKTPIICTSCSAAPNAVYFNSTNSTIDSPFAIDSVGLLGLLQQLGDTNFAVEVQVLSTGEYSSDSGNKKYADLKVIAANPSRIGKRDTIRITSPLSKGRRKFNDPYRFIEPGQILFLLLAEQKSQPTNLPSAISSYTDYKFIDCLPLAIVAWELNEWKSIRDQFGLIQRGTSTTDATLQAYYQQDKDYIDLRVAPTIQGGVSFDFQSQTIIKYDTTLFGSYILKTNKISGPDGQEKLSPDEVLTFTVSSSRSILSQQEGRANINYTVEVTDEAADAVSVYIRPDSTVAQPLVFDPVLKGEWNLSQKLASNTPKVSLRINADLLSAGDVVSFRQSDNQNQTSVTIPKPQKHKHPKLDSVSSTLYSSDDILVFYGENLLQRGTVIYVPCEIADPEVPLRGHCNIQGWHQRGQLHSHTELGYIVPKTYSHGMNRRTDLIPRSGEVYLKREYGHLEPTGISIKLKN